MSDMKEFRLEAVPARAKRARETSSPWEWVEPTVWTERMLTALIEGVKGGAWYSLMDKVHPQRVLRAAYSRVAANEGAAGVDHVTVTRGTDHQRWPNAFFDNHGLFSLKRAHASARQSSLR